MQTKESIGSVQLTKAVYNGLRVLEIYHESSKQELRLLAIYYRQRYDELLRYSAEDEIQTFEIHQERLRPSIVDAGKFTKVGRKSKCSMLVESAQASSTTGQRFKSNGDSTELLRKGAQNNSASPLHDLPGVFTAGSPDEYCAYFKNHFSGGGGGLKTSV